MINIPSQETQEIHNKPRGGRMLLIGGLSFLALFLVSLLISVYEFRYHDKALPGVIVGGINVGGMTHEEIEEALFARNEDMLGKGLTVVHGETRHIITLQQATNPDLSSDFITMDTDIAARLAWNYGRVGSLPQRFSDSILALFRPTPINISDAIQIDGVGLGAEVRQALGSYEEPGRPTDFVFDLEANTAHIELGYQGTELDLQAFFVDLENDLQDLSLSPITVSLTNSAEPLPVEEANSLVTDAFRILNLAPITLTYTTDTQRTYNWSLSREQLADILVPKAWEHGVRVGVEEAKLTSLFTEIGNTINIAPTDARFRIENGKVVEFVGSKEGVAFDSVGTIEAIESTLSTVDLQKPATVTLLVQTAEPDILTGEVNDLGITEVLGVGWSGWKGSPPNRIKNIRHATEKLNGLLIAPGEQVSLTSKLGPLTLEDGYLPEMVIAGDEIKPEIAGGLCQIGTTVFRAAMHAGLQIDQRRNHSLVVSYYNDPQNGNPGTDATLYEPVLDLKFTNTTSHHILLTTEFNEPGQELIYTFWGTNSDGRKAYYTPPQVLSRTSPGPTQYKDTTTLPPGQMKCQHAYSGAKTTFDYIIEYPDGTRKVQNFTSQYRALPQICLVGIDPNAPPPVDETAGDGGGANGTTDTIDTTEEPIPLIP